MVTLFLDSHIWRAEANRRREADIHYGGLPSALQAASNQGRRKKPEESSEEN